MCLFLLVLVRRSKVPQDFPIVSASLTIVLCQVLLDRPGLRHLAGFIPEPLFQQLLPIFNSPQVFIEVEVSSSSQPPPRPSSSSLQPHCYHRRLITRRKHRFMKVCNLFTIPSLTLHIKESGDCCFVLWENVLLLQTGYGWEKAPLTFLFFGLCILLRSLVVVTVLARIGKDSTACCRPCLYIGSDPFFICFCNTYL